jgi:hypothetical protein
MFLYCRECASGFQCDNDSKAVHEIFRNSEIETSLLQKIYDFMQQTDITKTVLSSTRNGTFVYKNLGIKFMKTTKKSATVQKNYAKRVFTVGAVDEHKNTQDCAENFSASPSLF